MSLHNLANHLQSAGRGEDKVLVHMTPGEVNGLQSLAMSQGGSLTINPETGLPEAGILSSLLPIVAGAFLGPAGLGLTAMQTGLAVGALGTAATGSLGKGLMMGFGAYGGAGLGEGLMNAGANVVGDGSTALQADPRLAVAEQANNPFAVSADQLKPSNFGVETSSIPTGPVSQTGAFNPYQPQGLNLSQGPFAGTTDIPNAYGGTGVSAANYPNAPTIQTSTAPVYQAPTSALTGGAPNVLETTSINTPTGINTAPTPAVSTAPSNFDKVGAGIKDVTSSGAKAWDFVKEHPGPFIGLGVGALQEYQEQQAKDAANAAKSGSPGMIRPYEMSVAQNESAYAPNPSTAERQYFVQPRYIAGTPYAAKEGGLMGIHKYAVGGPVERMSAQNAIGDNTMYPQSQLQTDMYSNPMMQRPMPTNVIQSGLDASVDRYTGEAKFALGGSALAVAKAKEPTSDVKYAFDPATQKFTQTTTSAPAASNFSGNPFIDGMVGLFGVGPYAMGGNKGIGMGGFNPNGLMAKLNAQATPQPTTTTQTSGGISAPAMQAQQPQTQPANPIVPNINIPQQQDVNQQLGLQAFYPMMEQQLAAKGARMQNQNMAGGGLSGGYNPGMSGMGSGGNMLKALRDPEFKAKAYKDNLDVHGQVWMDRALANPGNTMTKNLLASGKAQYEQLNAPKATTSDNGINAFAIPDPVANPQFVNMVPNIQLNQQQQENDPFYQMMQSRLSGMGGYQGYADGGMAGGGYNLGGYSDGGRLLRGPGDGVSDSIPASIGNRQPARLADGEFVVPARIVSEIGNGSTEAGARKLYAMMDRVQKARGRTTGKNNIAINTKAEKLLPA